jgi:hypothetical protein
MMGVKATDLTCGLILNYLTMPFQLSRMVGYLPTYHRNLHNDKRWDSSLDYRKVEYSVGTSGRSQMCD